MITTTKVNPAASEAAENAYLAKYDNLDEVWHITFYGDPRWLELLHLALDRGTPLDRAEVMAKFGGDPGWDE